MVVSAATGSPHIPIITAIPLRPPDLDMQKPCNQLLFLPPSCLGGEQMPEGDLHAEVGPKPQLNPRSCANKGENGKFIHADSGAVN